LGVVWIMPRRRSSRRYRGADPDDVVRAMAVASYEATFKALFVLTAEEDIAALVESRAAVALHEDLLTAGPTGQEGQDLFR
jgi:hypothetical protein